MMLIMTVGSLISEPVMALLIKDDSTPFITTFGLYFAFFGLWIAYILYNLIVKSNRPILRSATHKTPGNNIKNLLIGLLIGFLMNGTCILAAFIHKDIQLYYNGENVIQVIIVFVAVLIQSGAEELLCRSFLYQRLRRGYKSPLVAILGNALVFSVLHIFNDGVTVLAIINITVAGILFSLMVYYFDSLWMAIAAHTAWNFMQNIIFGLPNSGNVTPFSIFKLEASNARDSFCYNVGFGGGRNDPCMCCYGDRRNSDNTLRKKKGFKTDRDMGGLKKESFNV